jgi:hypothetical protein
MCRARELSYAIGTAASRSAAARRGPSPAINGRGALQIDVRDHSLVGHRGALYDHGDVCSHWVTARLTLPHMD